VTQSNKLKHGVLLLRQYVPLPQLAKIMTNTVAATSNQPYSWPLCKNRGGVSHSHHNHSTAPPEACCSCQAPGHTSKPSCWRRQHAKKCPTSAKHCRWQLYAPGHKPGGRKDGCKCVPSAPFSHDNAPSPESLQPRPLTCPQHLASVTGHRAHCTLQARRTVPQTGT